MTPAMSQFAATLLDQRPSRRILIAYLLLVAALLVLSVLAAIYDRFPGDLALARAIQDIDSAAFRGAMRFSTDATSPVYSLATMAVVVSLLLLLGRRLIALLSACALLSHALGGLLKVIVNRSRPDPGLIETVRLEEAYSFPSGHVEWVVSFEGFLVFAVYQLTPSTPLRAVATGAWLVHLVLTSLGRVDQGLHWPSDVVASYLVGAISLLFLIWLYHVLESILVDRTAGQDVAQEVAIDAD